MNGRMERGGLGGRAGALNRSMHRIHYAGDSFLTGTDIAVGLLDYAQALATAGTSATVEIPTVADDGTPGRSLVLVGPASQLVADAEASPFDEVIDPVLVERLKERSIEVRRRSSATPAVAPGKGDPTGDWREDWGGLDIV